jgi:opacity protein-like surface antigen
VRPIATLAFAAALASSSAAFGAGSFDGFYVGAGLGLRGTSSKLSEPSTGTQIDGIGTNDIFGSFLAGYSFSPDGGFNIAGNVWYELGDATTHVDSAAPGASVDYKLKNTFGLSIEPGWYLGTDTLSYLKASYARTEGEFSGSIPTESKSFNGFGYGVGLKHLMTPNLFVYVEAEQRVYNSETFSSSVDVKPKETHGIIGVGWKF